MHLPSMLCKDREERMSLMYFKWLLDKSEDRRSRIRGRPSWGFPPRDMAGLQRRMRSEKPEQRYRGYYQS